MNDFDEIFEVVGTAKPDEPNRCKDCNRRICPQEEAKNYPYVLTCPNCFECAVVTREEFESHKRALDRANDLWEHRQELRRKYGRNSKAYDELDGYKEPITAYGECNCGLWDDGVCRNSWPCVQ